MAARTSECSHNGAASQATPHTSLGESPLGIPAELLAWDAEEAFYRAYHNAADEGPTAREVLLARTDPALPYVSYACDPSTINAHLIEGDFFAEGRAVAVVKHPRCLPRFAHHHDFFEAAYVLQGGCRQRILDAELDLKPGDFCLIAPGVTHEVWADENDLVLNVLIRTSTFADLFLTSMQSGDKLGRFFVSGIYGTSTIPYALFATGDDTPIRTLILALWHEQQTTDCYAERMLTSLATILLGELMRRHGNAARMPTGVRSAACAGAEMLRVIVAQGGAVSLSEVAERVGYSVPATSKIIRALTGMTFSSFAENVRLTRAERLLLESGLSVANVAEATGYHNVETFTRAFKRTHSTAPGEWRRRNQIIGAATRPS